MQIELDLNDKHLRFYVNGKYEPDWREFCYLDEIKHPHDNIKCDEDISYKLAYSSYIDNDKIVITNFETIQWGSGFSSANHVSVSRFWCDKVGSTHKGFNQWIH